MDERGKVNVRWVTSQDECRFCKGTGKINHNRWITFCCDSVVRFESMGGGAYCSGCRQDVSIPSIWAEGIE